MIGFVRIAVVVAIVAFSAAQASAYSVISDPLSSNAPEIVNFSRSAKCMQFYRPNDPPLAAGSLQLSYFLAGPGTVRLDLSAQIHPRPQLLRSCPAPGPTHPSQRTYLLLDNVSFDQAAGSHFFRIDESGPFNWTAAPGRYLIRVTSLTAEGTVVSERQVHFRVLRPPDRHR